MFLFVVLINYIFAVYCIFFFTTCLTTIFLIHLSTKWHTLVKLVATSDLNDYLDPYIKLKCDFATITILCFAFAEHGLAVMAKFMNVDKCFAINANTTIYEEMTITTYYYIFDLNVPYTLSFGIFLQFFTLIITLAWSYPHVFIICISLFLTSILEVLNKKIISCEGQHLPASYWRALREDYNRATRLVRSFDDAINSIVFVGIGSNLFFMCTQFYFFLRSGTTIGSIGSQCPKDKTGLLNGYENIIYISFSLIFLLLRSFVILLVAARIHTASRVAAPLLYNVPSSSYCSEVQRFLEQIHGDTVALTGLNFFSITKQLVLSVVGTLVTYELVLLQFNKDGNIENDP